jgi:hypothetical protein
VLRPVSCAGLARAPTSLLRGNQEAVGASLPRHGTEACVRPKSRSFGGLAVRRETDKRPCRDLPVIAALDPTIYAD